MITHRGRFDDDLIKSEDTEDKEDAIISEGQGKL